MDDTQVSSHRGPIDSAPAGPELPFMIQELLHRRVPHIVGAYLAAGWLVLEFTDWVVNRYVLSSHLADFIVVGWLVLLPGVFMVAWFHGKPGRNRWTRFERIGLAANVVVAAGVMFGLFRGRDLGAATTTVLLEDEDGNAIERVIPKSEFRKSVVVFPFDNGTEDSDYDWLEYGVPSALHFDLTQDLFLNVPSAEAWLGELREEGYGDGLDVPLTLKRDVAGRLHAGYFVAGAISDSAGTPEFVVSLYETRRGKKLHERSYAGADPLAAVDGIGEQLRHDLELPAQHIEETPNLPIAEMLTTNPAAYRSYIAGEEAALKQDDYAAAAEHWEAAVAVDPSFAMAWLRLFEARTLLNEAARGEAALESAIGLLYRVPERVQFQAKVTYYWFVRRDVERATATARMWAELFPDDVVAHARLAQFLGMQAQIPEAIAALEKVLELDPGRVEQLRAIAALYQSEGQYEIALRYLRRYAESAPNDPAGFTAIGGLHTRLGDHVAAREAYNRALVIDPNDVGALISLANLDRDLGAFADAERGYAEARNAGVTPAQRAAAHAALQGYFAFRGRTDLAISHMRQGWDELARTLPPFVLVQEQLGDLGIYGRAGRAEEGWALLDSLTTPLAEQFRVLRALGETNLALESEDADLIEGSLEGFEQFIETFGLERLRFVLKYSEGRIAELRGDCRRAIARYGEALELYPANVAWKLDLGRCYRALGRSDAARANLEDMLRLVPVDPRVHYELALVYLDAGNREEALDHLRTAMDVWGEADADFPHARRARAKLAELEER